MKKRLISLVAAAALVGGMATVAPSMAQAGTVTVGGDTQVQLYGGVKFTSAWSKKTNGLNSNIAFDIGKAKKDLDLKTTASDKAWDKWNWNGFEMNDAGTILGVNFSNKDANLTGKIEIGIGSSNYLRHAYVEHHFDNGLYILVGQTNNTFEEHTFDMLPNATAGFNPPSRSPQIAAGGTFDIADSASLDFKLAFLNEDYIGNALNRRAFPTVGLNVGVNFNTGFGAPARVYGNALIEGAKITIDKGETEHSKTSSAFGVGFVLPVSMVTLQSEYIYAKGMASLAGLKLKGVSDKDVNTSTPLSYYEDDNGHLKALKWYAWNLEAKIAPMPCVSLAAGYDYFKVKHEAFNNKTFFINTAVKTTKYTTLGIEWDHMRTKWDDGYKATGNTFFTSYTYTF
ncbi:hypothetical protein [Hippea alviniae]|uniref:hypothetical protein n=1 Tax=Hippea alviniae TaxID=1279027 RepID=UPI0003B7B5B8|nr:hypothetical protein [Hippea alviniae]